MRLITGDECGLLKECIPELSRKEEDLNAPIKEFGAMPDVTLKGVCRIDPKERQSRSRGVVGLTNTDANDGFLSFAVLRQDGSIDSWEGSTMNKQHFGKYDNIFSSKNVFEDVELNGRLRTLGLGSFRKDRRLCAGDMEGNLIVVNADSGNVVQHYNGYNSSNGKKSLSYVPGKILNTQLATAMACDGVYGRVAIGGRERETTVLDLASGKVVFKAKNLPPDPQTLLQQPVWPTSILFFRDPSVMAVGTGYKQVRIYDVRENSKMRRPTAVTPEGTFEYRVTSLCQINEHRLVIGDAAGSIYDLDIRTLDRDMKRSDNNNLGRFVGPAGSVRELKKHPTLPLMAAVGLDRMLRIYDTDKRKLLDCVYLKQRLNSVLFSNDESWEVGQNGKASDDDDYDIDQDDLVEDYIDSDDEENETSRNRNQSTDEQSEEDDQSEDSDSSSSLASNSPVAAEKGMATDEESIEASDIDEDSSNESDSDDESEADDDDESSAEEEEVVIKTAKKRRRI